MSAAERFDALLSANISCSSDLETYRASDTSL